MMINTDYASIVANARANGSTSVNFDKPVEPTEAIKAKQDTVTLSQQAIALMNGDNASTEEVAPTYIKPETARSLLAQSDSNNATSGDVDKSEKANSFDEMMQAILDKRTGIDREKLDEINAMIEEIAKDEDLSPEQKEKAIEALEKMKEEVIEESMELQEVAAQTGEFTSTIDGVDV